MNLMDVLEAKRKELADIQLREESLKEDMQALERVIGMSPVSEGMVANSDINRDEIPVLPLASTLPNKISGMSFGKFLKQFCFENALSNNELGNLLGVSGASIGNWIKGKSRITESKKQEIAQRLQELSGNEFRAQEIVALI